MLTWVTPVTSRCRTDDNVEWVLAHGGSQRQSPDALHCAPSAMVSNKEAVQRALRAALDSWNWRPIPNSEFGDEPNQAEPSVVRVHTELSATVFSGEATEWVRYLKMPRAQRYEPSIGVRVHLQEQLRLLAFEPENEDSRWLSELLSDGFRRLRKRLESRPPVRAELDALLFENPSNRNAELSVRLSPEVPSDGTREMALEGDARRQEVRLVLHSRSTRYVKEALQDASMLSSDEKLGLYWPIVSRLISELAYPTGTLDRFASKIDVLARMTYVSLNTLYEDRKSGELLPSGAGFIYEHLVSDSTEIPRSKLFERHPFFRLLGRLGFMLRASSFASCAEDARIAAREYLDTVYLRLSLAGAMPEVPSAMRAMPFESKRNKVLTPGPQIGSYGIVDEEDLDAWKKVSHPFRDLGFTLLRQLGMGEFGRVYEAMNRESPNFPARVALKVDRILGKKKHAILEAEEAMIVGRELAPAPHLIRLYDTGKLRHQRSTYHVLQLVDGDTLDNLVGVTGTEHASVSRPPSARRSEGEAEQEYERAVSQRGSEIWRRRRMALPFRHALSPAVVLDLLTSVLLWLEEVHALGYAINDLKNGNLMMSRRGQLKGIDLDSYAPVHTPKDKVTDFMFLAVSLILLLFSAPVSNRGRQVHWEELIESEARLRQGLDEAWPFGEVEVISDGRVTREELIAVLVDLVQRSRRLVYAKRPDMFSDDIGRLVSIKRRMLFEEIVID